MVQQIDAIIQLRDLQAELVAAQIAVRSARQAQAGALRGPRSEAFVVYRLAQAHFDALCRRSFALEDVLGDEFYLNYSL